MRGAWLVMLAACGGGDGASGHAVLTNGAATMTYDAGIFTLERDGMPRLSFGKDQLRV